MYGQPVIAANVTTSDCWVCHVTFEAAQLLCIDVPSIINQNAV